MGTVYKWVMKVVGTDLWTGDSRSAEDSEGYATEIEDSGYDKQ